MSPIDPDITWILIAWLMPFWWGTLLLVVAFLGDVFPSCRGSASRLFDRLESMR